MPDDGPDAAERDHLLAEIGIAPRDSSSVLLPKAEGGSPRRARPSAVAAVPKPALLAGLARGRGRFCGGLMALAGAAWLGVGLAAESPLACLWAGLVLAPGLRCWLGREST